MVGADARIVFASARSTAAFLCTAMVAFTATQSVRAESTKFPNRPIQLIVPYAAGGATDAVARLLQQGMEKRLGQPILVINRPGASTTLGTQQVARAAPDGHTIAMVSVPHVANYTLLKEMPYAQSDFIPITPVTNTPNVLVVNPQLPIKSISDLVAYVKSRPGEINYGTFGIGSSAHLAALLFESKIGTKLQAVHYRGGAPAAVGVMTGEVQMAFGTPLSVAGGVSGGKLRPIAVTSEKRVNIYPEIPTVREQGLDYVNCALFGILAPAHTPDAIVRQLLDSITGTMAEPAVRKTIIDSGTEVFVTSPEEFSRFIANETKLWAGVLKGMAVEQQ
jgi:tripartite-type tricarboxylate transporter receptor subunit TctC